MKTLASMLRRVGVSLRAGIDARTVWEKESTYGSATYRQQAARVGEAVADGDSLAEAMDRCGDYFPPLTRTLVHVGEKTGRLDDVLEGVAEHYENLLALRRSFLLGIAWPAIELTLGILVVGLAIWIVGALTSSAGGGGVDILGFGLVGASGALTFFGLVVTVLAGTTVFVLALIRGALGPAPLQLAMRVPVIGNCLKNAALSRMAWTLSLALDSGIDAQRAMQLAVRSTENAYYTSRLDVIEEAITAGREFHEALRETELFPDDFVNSLEMAEMSGTHAESLERLAEDYRIRAQTSAKVLTYAATVAIWVLFALVILFFIVRFFLFYLGMITDPFGNV
jgi:type II secretory pathway component PulF